MPSADTYLLARAAVARRLIREGADPLLTLSYVLFPTDEIMEAERAAGETTIYVRARGEEPEGPLRRLGMKNYPAEMRARAYQLRAEGMSRNGVARLLDVAPATVGVWCEREAAERAARAAAAQQTAGEQEVAA